MKNNIGHEIPQDVLDHLALGLYGRETDARCAPKSPHSLKERDAGQNKLVGSIEEAVRAVGLKDGMTVSFHHHFREGDHILNQVMDVLARMGFKDLKVASSSLTAIHAPLIGHIQNGVVSRIESSGCRGKLADAISHGLMREPVIFRSHGGRASAIADGRLHIDVAFLGASVSDPFGNASGVCLDPTLENVAECGSLGYARVDAQYADKVVILTNNITGFPNMAGGIKGTQVDCVVRVDSIGDPSKISSGAARYTTNPRDLLIAERAAQVVIHSGYFNDGFSLQTGTGGSALAVTRFLADEMVARGIKAKFGLGGITGQMVKLHEQGLIENLLDVQCFDTVAAESLRKNPRHHEIDGNDYASPFNRAAAINQLDIVVLSALEIDTRFNVNVLLGSDGIIRGAIGGHPDTAAGAALTVIVNPLIRGRLPCVVDAVNTLCTDGRDCDVLVTDAGIAVNPARPEVRQALLDAGIELTTIEQLKADAEAVVGRPDPLPFGRRVVAVVTAPDGNVIDAVYEVED